jgi:NAD(P)-dependent dehydrogenase (short-subunit alcohol dehydrogenase family)
MHFKNRVVLITGGGSGIGKACALRFAREGARVAIAGLDVTDLTQVREAIQAEGGQCFAIRCDVGSVEDIQELVASITENFGELHVLVNNAATVDLSEKIQDLAVTDWDQCLNASLRSVFLLSKLLSPIMGSSGGGAIINLGSVGALAPWSGGAAYCAAKAGVLALTKVIAIELASLNIRVNAISPGAIATPNLQRAIDRLGHAERLKSKSVFHRIGEPDEVAAAIAFLAGDEASFITGANLLVDGGFTIQ